MPYITTEKVKEYRNKLKREFPQFKFSVRREHYSSVRVNILSGPIDFGGTNRQVNHYYIEEHWKDNPTACEFLQKVKSIVGGDEREVSYDGDYGSIPNYWYSISIGSWDREYVIKK
jgi:hypothetical protein